MRACQKCGTEVKITDRVGRSELCKKCGAFLHCCLNCNFYDPSAHNQCRENQAELVVDKESGNFCDYFQYKDSTYGKSSVNLNPREKAKSQLDALFRKK